MWWLMGIMSESLGGEVENKIKVLRAMKELTQERLAERVGVTRQTILAIEKGKYVPSLLLAFKIARVFGVGVEEVFSYKKVRG